MADSGLASPAMGSPTACSPTTQDAGDMEQKQRPWTFQPDQNLSPSRKAILAKFNQITTMGPPIAQPNFVPSPNAMAGLDRNGSPARPGRQSPFKRALMNSQRGNLQVPEQPDTGRGCTGKQRTKSSASSHLSSSAGGDVSMSLHLSARMSANTSVEYDLMNAPDDSLLVEAKNMGDESFERKIMSKHASPSKASSPIRSRSVSPRKNDPLPSDPRPAASCGQTSPVRRPRADNALGLGLPSPERSAAGKGQAANTTQKSDTRSFSLTSDTSNIFDEQGEMSLLYASMRVKNGRVGGARAGKVQNLLNALAEGTEDDGEVKAAKPPRPIALVQDVFGAPAPPQASSSKINAVRPSQSSAASQKPSSSRNAAAPSQIRPRGSTAAAPASAAPVKPTASRDRPWSAVPPSARASGASPAQIRASTSRPMRAPPDSTPVSSGPRPAATPRSRPPLSTPARRLSGLPQMMDSQGRPSAGSGTSATTTKRNGTAQSTSSNAVASPTRTTAAAAPRTVGRPSLAPRGMAAPSSVATSKSALAGQTATTGQLPRRSVATSTTAAAVVKPSAVGPAKRPARPFLLGNGTNHAAANSEPATEAQGARRGTPPRPMHSSRKSIATSTVPASRVGTTASSGGRFGIPKSSSTSQVSAAATPARRPMPAPATAISGALATPVRRPLASATAVHTGAGGGLPRPRQSGIPIQRP